MAPKMPAQPPHNPRTTPLLPMILVSHAFCNFCCSGVIPDASVLALPVANREPRGPRIIENAKISYIFMVWAVW